MLFLRNCRNLEIIYKSTQKLSPIAPPTIKSHLLFQTCVERGIGHSLIYGNKGYRGGLSILCTFFAKIIETNRKSSNLPYFLSFRWSQTCYFCLERGNREKMRKRGWNFHDFCVTVPLVKKNNFLSSHCKNRDVYCQSKDLRPLSSFSRTFSSSSAKDKILFEMTEICAI